MLLFRSMFLGCVLLTSGCASMAPRYERPAVEVPTHYAEASPAGVSGAADLAWQDYVTDPELRALVERALEANRDLRGALLRVEQARAAWGITRSERVPAVGAGLQSERTRVPADLSITRQPMVSSSHQFGVGFSSWELDLWGRVRSQNEAAIQNWLATQEAQRAVTLLLVAQVADGYLGLRELDQRLSLAEQALATRAESRRVFQRRQEVGSSSELELVQADLLWQQAQVLVSQLELARATQMHAFAVLIGEPGLELPPRAAPLHEQMTFAPLSPGLPSELLENRPDIRAAEHTLQAANAQIGAARAMYFPRIALTTFAGTASAELDGLFASGSRAWNFAPGISLPIFDGGRRRANLRLSEVQREQAVNAYGQTIEAAFRDVADALAARQYLGEQLTTLRAMEETLARRAELAKRRFDAGAARYFEVLDAERDLLAAQQDVVQAGHALMSAQLSLYTALGGGSQVLEPASVQ